MSRKSALNLIRAPASRKIRAKTRSVGVALFFTLPVLVHAALCRGSPQPLQRASGTGSANATALARALGQVESDGVFGTCWGKRQSCATVAT